MTTRRTTRPKKTSLTATVRVAIYCRQSVADDKEFGSLQAQREAVESFVQSQSGDGWEVLPQRYDDGGFSGANTDRPALRHDTSAGSTRTRGPEHPRRSWLPRRKSGGS